MGGKGSGRLNKTDSILKKSTQKFTPIASGEMFLPNHSGDHSAGTTKTPTDDQHLVNKKYVDDNFIQSPKQNTIMGYNRNLSCSGGTEKFIHIADTVVMTDTKGLTAIRDGSIVGISINWDAGFPSGAMSGINLRVKVNGSAVWDNDIGASNGNDQEAQFTQARDTDSFSAGDTISVCLEAVGVGSSIILSKIIVSLEYYYDD